MYKMNDTGRVKGRLRPLRALCCFRTFVCRTRRFSSSLVNQRPVRVRELSFLTLARVLLLNLPFWAKVFTGLNCVVLVAFSFFYAETLLVLFVVLFKCLSYCILQLGCLLPYIRSHEVCEAFSGFNCSTRAGRLWRIFAVISRLL